jgi:hypothetical protein
MYSSTLSGPQHWLEVRGQLHTPTLEERVPRFALDRTLGGSQSWSGQHGELIYS